jgi:hypothetical protein
MRRRPDRGRLAKGFFTMVSELCRRPGTEVARILTRASAGARL